MKGITQRLLDLGISKSNQRHEIKRIRLLNMGALAWILSSMLFLLVDSLFGIDIRDNLITHSCAIALMVGILVLQRFGIFQIARHVFILIAMTIFVAFANILEPGGLMEYLLLCIPIFSLVLIKNKWTNLAVLFCSYACFIVSLEQNYTDINIKPTASLVLFFSIYLSFGYFKRLNVKNEESLENQRKQLESQRNLALEANTKIETQRRELEELNEFQSHFWVNLSHEIRTPLTLIKGSSNQLLKSKGCESSRPHFERIDKNTNDIQLLVDNIMDLAKMKVNKLELQHKPIDIIDLCKKTITSFEALFAEKNLQYNFANHTIHHDLFILGDKLFLERALSNVILNAYKYTNAGSIELIIAKNSDQISISVIDTGCGIPKSEIDHVFDSFYRSQNSLKKAGGTGLGLSFAKEVLLLHDSTIEVDSIENQGTIFTIAIPQHLPTEEAKTPVVPDLEISVPKTKKHILVVEDHSEMRAFITETLHDYFVTEVTNGKEALAILEKTTPDLIITDYWMPELNGFELVEEIKQMEMQIPIIVLTGQVNQDGKLAFLKFGIDDYLTKPFHQEELILRVTHCLTNVAERARFNKENESVIPSTEDDSELQAITKVISEHIENAHFGVMDLAEKFAITERTLHRKIKSNCGLTPNALIREVKLQKARTLCDAAKVQSLKELASEIGFVNTGHLVKLYKERFGIRPHISSELSMAVT